jgi:DNA repair exonuclease SbcCD nuclease subunit
MATFCASISQLTVPPSGQAHDVIRISEIPPAFGAVLCGHIHRFQVLSKDLRGRQLSSPVFYPGAIERTSFAEKNEKKDYVTLVIETQGRRAGRLTQWKFHELYARPMVQLEVHPEMMNAAELEAWIKNSLAELPWDSVVKLKIHGVISDETMQVLSAPTLRSLAPQTMNISAAFPK